MILGFNVLDLERSERVTGALNLARQAVQQAITQQEYEETVKQLGGLDKTVETLARTEQSFLRKSLFGTSVHGECGICGRLFPVELLVTAHIKQRAECSDDEKVDYRRNVMPMCKLGCDELFERGYIVVTNGTVSRNPANSGQLTQPVHSYLENVVGRKCPHWERGEQYFNWHTDYHGSP